MKTRTRLAALAAASLLAACGGGSDYDNTPPTTTPPATTSVPGSASASVAGFIAYLQLLVVSSADTLEPVDTSLVVGQTSDTTEPTPIN